MGMASEPKARAVPVSRVSFALTDRNAFDDAVKLAVAWIATTAGTSLSDEAYDGLDFEISGQDAKASASALRLDDTDGRIWAAKAIYHADKSADRQWITDLFVEQRAGSFARFGAQLTCQCGPGDPGFEHSRPRVIRDALDRLAGEADGEALTNEVQSVGVDDIDHLVSLLYNPARRLPVILVSVDDFGGAQIELDRLAVRLSGTAHLRSVSIEPSFELSRNIGKRMSTFNGAVRIYMPGLEPESEDPFQHPLWLAPNSGRSPRLINQLASRVLPLGFRDADGDARFWRVGLLRQASSRAAANTNAGTGEEQNVAEIAALKAELEASRESASSAEALMYEESAKLSDVQADVARLEDENFVLRSRITSLASASPENANTLSANDIYDVFENTPTLEVSLRVIANVFSDRVVVLDSAYQSARDSHSFRHRKRAFDLLWTLCASYWSALISGQSDVTAKQCFGASYAAKEAETISKEGRRRRTFVYAGEDIEMEKHLKIGVADNKAETLRVHFEWLSNESKIVIGYCGGHLNF